MIRLSQHAPKIRPNTTNRRRAYLAEEGRQEHLDILDELQLHLGLALLVVQERVHERAHVLLQHLPGAVVLEDVAQREQLVEEAPDGLVVVGC